MTYNHNIRYTVTENNIITKKQKKATFGNHTQPWTHAASKMRLQTCLIVARLKRFL